MKKILAVAALAVAAVVYADKTVTFDSTKVTTHTVHLHLLADGGCSVEGCATVLQKDGGQPPFQGCESAELSGTNRTRCLNVLSDADALWKSRQGL